MGISNNNIKKKSRYGVSIIVTSYNTKVLLKNCIDSVIKNTRGIDYEIIIVDNDSTDGTRDYLSTLQKNKRVKVVLNKKNLGFGRGNNIGIEKSVYDYLLFLNSDTVLITNVIAAMVEWMRTDKKIGCASCSLKNADGTTQGTGGYFPNLIRVFSWMVIQDFPLVDKLIKPFHPMKSGSPFKNDNFYATKKELDWVTGAFMLMRRGAVLDTGFFDSDYFMYTEEVDYLYRMKKYGWRVLYNPKWSIIHLGGKSGVSGSNITLEFKGVEFFFKKHYPAWQYPLLRIILKVGCLGRMILFGILKGRVGFITYAKAYTIV